MKKIIFIGLIAIGNICNSAVVDSRNINYTGNNTFLNGITTEKISMNNGVFVFSDTNGIHVVNTVTNFLTVSPNYSQVITNNIDSTNRICMPNGTNTFSTSSITIYSHTNTIATYEMIKDVTNGLSSTNYVNALESNLRDSLSFYRTSLFLMMFALFLAIVNLYVVNYFRNNNKCC